MLFWFYETPPCHLRGLACDSPLCVGIETLFKKSVFHRDIQAKQFHCCRVLTVLHPDIVGAELDQLAVGASCYAQIYVSTGHASVLDLLLLTITLILYV